MFGIDDAILASLAAPVITALIGNVGASSRQDAMNAYNAPIQQMRRYAQAGLNPNLIYSQGTPGNMSSPTAFMTPDVDPVKIWSAVTQAKESRLRRQSLYWKSKASELLSDYQHAKNAAVIPQMPKQAEYQTSIMRHQIQNMAINWGLAATRGEGAVWDNRLKAAVLSEKQYYNQLRDYGIEKGDNPFYRMGTLLFRKAVPHFRLR